MCDGHLANYERLLSQSRLHKWHDLCDRKSSTAKGICEERTRSEENSLEHATLIGAPSARYLL